LISEVFRHGDYIDVDVAKTGDNMSLHSPVIKALNVLHEQCFIPVFNYDMIMRVCLLYTNVSASNKFNLHLLIVLGTTIM